MKILNDHDVLAEDHEDRATSHIAEAAPGQATGDESENTPRYWVGLEDLANTPEFRERVANEFPRYAPQEWEDDASRRDFLKLSGASVALAGLTACTRQPSERIIPYVEQPDGVIYGKPDYYATTFPLAGYGQAVIAKSREGRPIKLSGNPGAPSSKGGTGLVAQSEILRLYDPDRKQGSSYLGRLQPWATVVAELRAPLLAQQAIGGEGLAILTGAQSGPTFERLMGAVKERLPRARWFQYDALARDEAREAARRAFGRDACVHYDLAKADVVLALDADFLNEGPGHVRYASDFAARRQVAAPGDSMNRLYALETSLSGTGATADHRRSVSAHDLATFTVALAARLGVSGSNAGLEDDMLRRWLDAVSEDLGAHRGRSLVIAGDYAPVELQVLALAINQALGNIGETVIVTDPVLLGGDGQAGLRDLAAAMEGGDVQALFVLGANPVYDSAADIDFGAAMENVDLRVHVGLHTDETAALCHWQIGGTHFLESWGDCRSFDGTLSVIQPLIEPLYDGKSDLEILALIAGQTNVSSYDLVRNNWRDLGYGEGAWRRALHDGYVADSALAHSGGGVSSGAASAAASALAQKGASASDGYDVQFRPDPAIRDGRYANNGWLQEVPRPITLLTWDNAAIVAPADAEHLGTQTGDVVWLQDPNSERRLDLPVLVQPGQPRGTITVHIGYGRAMGGRVADGVGSNANLLRTADSPWSMSGVTVEKSGRFHKLATTQSHFVIRDLDYELKDYQVEEEQVEKRHLIKEATLEHFREDPEFAAHLGHSPPLTQLFPRWKYEGYSWGMAIDLTTCTGCQACVVSCQAENNIPVVGREKVIEGREMQWLRIDRYFEGPIDQPRIHHQPMPCQQCEQAPCEVVCPVAATVHGPEGLNQMIYNRCVGTRYCSNNCPFKVRRFNFLQYNYHDIPVLDLAQNPEVSVRARGVMEKCTYCVQRINAARGDAKVAGRRIHDGEVQTACQEACPTNAITFGDLNDANSEVNRKKALPTNYTLLDELQVLPRTSYLARIANVNPALAEQEPYWGAHGSHEPATDATHDGGDHAGSEEAH